MAAVREQLRICDQEKKDIESQLLDSQEKLKVHAGSDPTQVVSQKDLAEALNGQKGSLNLELLIENHLESGALSKFPEQE